MAQERPYRPVFSVLATVIVVAAAIVLAWFAWNRYETAPWTRDARVRAHAIFVAPEVSGRILAVPVGADAHRPARLPLHIAIDHVPAGVVLSAGLTGTVHIVQPAHQHKP